MLVSSYHLSDCHQAEHTACFLLVADTLLLDSLETSFWVNSGGFPHSCPDQSMELPHSKRGPGSIGLWTRKCSRLESSSTREGMTQVWSQETISQDDSTHFEVLRSSLCQMHIGPSISSFIHLLNIYVLDCYTTSAMFFGLGIQKTDPSPSRRSL